MNARFPSVVLLAIGLVSLTLAIGCGSQDQAAPTAGDQDVATAGDQDVATPAHGHEHGGAVDPHDVPLTEEQKEQLNADTAKFGDAIARIKQFRDTIREETKAGIPESPFEAHQALDRVDLVLQWLPRIARDSSVPQEHLKAVNTAANELRESFEKIHQNIDDKADPDFASVGQQIDAQLTELDAIVP